MNLKKIIKLFEEGNVCVTGLRGTGKDMLQGNVIVRRKKPYISNVDYGGDYIPYDYDLTFGLNGNTFKNFIDGKVIPYSFPYPDGTDIYLSDIGVYFPSQECAYLDKNYKGIPLFMSLSRHLGNCNVHCNCQRLLRAYTKIREQSETFIRSEWCKVFFGKLVIQSVCIYDREESCQASVPPCPFKVPFFAPRQSKELYKMKQMEYRVAHGSIKRLLLVYINKASYDTRIFKKVLGGD